MATNKVEYYGKVLIDLTTDTVDKDTLHKGVTAHDKSGEVVTGTFTLENEITVQERLISEIKTVLQGKAAGVSPTPTQEKTVNIAENSTVEVTPDEGYSLAKVTVNVNVPTGGTDTRLKDYFEGTMSEIDDSSITTLRSHALRSSPLVSIRFENVTSVGGYAFNACNNLATLDLPKATGEIGAYACTSCSNLTEVNIPNITKLGNYSFQYCSKIARIALGDASSIGTAAFNSCTNLTTLIIRRMTNSVTSLSNKNALAYTKIEDGTGYVYVPASLVDAFKAATNWSAYANQIRAIEDYPEICGGA